MESQCTLARETSALILGQMYLFVFLPNLSFPKKQSFSLNLFIMFIFPQKVSRFFPKIGGGIFIKNVELRFLVKSIVPPTITCTNVRNYACIYIYIQLDIQSISTPVYRLTNTNLAFISTKTNLQLQKNKQTIFSYSIMQVSDKLIYFTITFLLFSLLLCTMQVPPTIASRALLNDKDQLQKMKTSSKSSISENIEDFLKVHGLSVDSIKSSGPSSRGAGHRKVKGLPSLRTLKDSGPTPGVGHNSVTTKHH